MFTLIEALNDFLKVDRADSTTTNYRRILNRLLAALGSQTDLQDVTLSKLLAYNQALATNLQPSSLYAYSLVIKAFFSWCEKVEYLESSPARRLVVRKPLPGNDDKGIPPHHAQAIRRVASANPRDYALVLFFAETGARVGAVSRLRLGNLYLGECRATLVEKGSKPVHVFFGLATAAALQTWLDVRPAVGHDCVWTRRGDFAPLSTAGVTEILRRLSLRACGVEYGPHKWRHTISERLEDAGVADYDIQHKLNHANAQVTKQHYLRNRNPNVRSLAQKFPLIAFGDSTEVASNIIRLDDAG